MRAISNTPGSSSGCARADELFLTELAGGSVFRFHDGSLLNVKLERGGLHQSDDRAGSLHIVLPDQWWNRPFQARIGGANNERNIKRRAIRCPRQPSHFRRDRGV